MYLYPARVKRLLAIALLLAALVVALLLTVGANRSDYTITAVFNNASQIVKGDLIKVDGDPVGKITKIQLTDDGRARLTLSFKHDHPALRRGTIAVVRQTSLSSVANRYIDLQLGPHGGAPIPDGGQLDANETRSAVDIDQLFDIFDKPTREALQDVIKGSQTQYAGRGKQFREGLLYLNPALASSSRLFDQLSSDDADIEGFVVSSSKLVSDIADRRDDLAGTVDHLATTFAALSDERSALAESIQRLPDFMRRANTTFVNLRGALDDLDPLVADSKPVARKLRPFLAQLRPLARDARPTLRDLSATISRPGKANDLIDLTRLAPNLKQATVDNVTANGKTREGAFPATTKALKAALPELSFARPYAPDLLGWFDDFSNSGIYDALGAASRASLNVNAFALANGQLSFVPPALRNQLFQSTATYGQTNRCPGAGDHTAGDGTNVYKPSPDYPCDATQVLPGK